MSTIALWAADAAGTAAEPKTGPGFLRRLIQAREKEVARRVQVYLALQADERLRDLGLSEKAMEALREGRAVLRAR